MAGKKGVIPSHVQKKAFSHPGMGDPFIQILEGVEDPRKPSLFLQYSLTSVLFMVLVTQVCGAKDWPQTVVMCEGMQDWLAQYVDMSAGVPCERTFKNLFNAIKPESMENLLKETANLIREKVPKEVIGFDGQTERGTASISQGIKGTHILSAWSTHNQICLGQMKVDDKSNEITAMPALMSSLDLQGTIVTADAMNTQKTIVLEARKGGADYLLPVKGNQPTLLEEIKSGFEQLKIEQEQAKIQWEAAVGKAKDNKDKGRLKELLEEGPSNCGATAWESLEKGHGRIESRNCTTLSAEDLPSQAKWKDLNTIVQIRRERQENGVLQQETVYYITSLGQEAETIANAVRKHWQIENSLHWSLDVTFQQDRSRYRDLNGAQNMASCRKVALNLLKQETDLKRGIATKQAAAACNPSYRDKIFKNWF